MSIDLDTLHAVIDSFQMDNRDLPTEGFEVKVVNGFGIDYPITDVIVDIPGQTFKIMIGVPKSE